MKISKLLPITLAFMLCTSAAMAETSPTANSPYNLTVDKFINITHKSTKNADTVAVDDTYTTGTIADLSGTFTAVTNYSQKLYLYSEVKTSDVAKSKKGLAGASPTDLKLVFTNTNAEENKDLLTETQLVSMQTSEAVEDSPNAIMFKLTVTPSFVENTYSFWPGSGQDGTGTPIPTATYADNVVTFDIPNSNSKYDVKVSGSTLESSLNTLDQNGTYVSTLYLTNVAP